MIEKICELFSLVPSLAVKNDEYEVILGWFAILLPFQQYFSHISPMKCDNERLCAVEPGLWLKRSMFPVGI